mgnify:CR=1 FL=1
MKLPNAQKLWVYFGVSCLLLSGFLTSPMLLGKIPFIKEMLPGVKWIRWSLVIHVILATIIWHTAIPIGLMCKGSQKSITEAIGPILCILGIVFMFSGLPNPGVEIILANYIPVITHRYFYFGLFLVLTGLTLGIIQVSFNLIFRPQGELLSLRPALLSANLYFILGIFTLVDAYLRTPKDSEYFELLMWGGGHLFQHSSAIYLVIAWQLLLQQLGSPGLNVRNFFVVLCGFLWPVIFLPGILFNPIESSEYRLGFTWLMRWGIFPGIIIYLLFFLYDFSKLIGAKNQNNFIAGKSALIGSIALIVVGMIFGAFIEGSDLRIPGHYHASIGGITVAFMGLSLALLIDNNKANKVFSLLRKAIIVYVPGQILFAGGMFAAGYFGVERKTYGSGLIIETSAQKLSFAILGIGGTIAFIGGFLFFLSFLKLLKVSRCVEQSST